MPSKPWEQRSNSEETADVLSEAQTSWGELKSNGVEMLEAASTTFPPNDRFVFIRDGTVLNRDQINNLVTHKPPLYEIEVQPGETWIIRGKDRNPYTPGLDSLSGIASEVDDTGPSGQFVPDGIELATGYALLTSGSEEGFPLIFEPNDVRQTIYKSGSQEVSKSVSNGEWDFDPFNSDYFNYDLSKFAVKRQEFDLYGAGDETTFLKIRGNDGRSHYVECVTVGIEDDPILEQYNLPSSVRVTADSGRSNPYTVRVGPLNFYNRGNIEVPSRTKKTSIRGETVSDDIGDNTHTVLGVYRLKDAFKEVSVNINTLLVKAGSSECRVEVREVLPEFLNNLPADSEWIAPGTQNPDETAIEGVEAGNSANIGEYTVGDITLDTYTTSQGKTIPRGRQIDVGFASGGQGNTPGRQETLQMQEKISELKYLVIVGQVEGGSGSILRIVPEFKQRW